MENKWLSKSFYGAGLVAMVCCFFAFGSPLETTAAWQVSGKVTDIHGNAIGGAQVCPQGSATGCVTTATNGTFTISGNSVGVRLDPSAQPSDKAVTLDVRKGKLFLNTPGVLRGKLELFDASGCRLAVVNDLTLVQGPKPSGCPCIAFGVYNVAASAFLRNNGSYLENRFGQCRIVGGGGKRRSAASAT